MEKEETYIVAMKKQTVSRFEDDGCGTVDSNPATSLDCG